MIYEFNNTIRKRFLMKGMNGLNRHCVYFFYLVTIMIFDLLLIVIGVISFCTRFRAFLFIPLSTAR